MWRYNYTAQYVVDRVAATAGDPGVRTYRGNGTGCVPAAGADGRAAVAAAAAAGPALQHDAAHALAETTLAARSPPRALCCEEPPLPPSRRRCLSLGGLRSQASIIWGSVCVGCPAVARGEPALRRQAFDGRAEPDALPWQPLAALLKNE